MKTRWVRIAVYNIKLSLYERKRHKSLKKGKKSVYIVEGNDRGQFEVSWVFDILQVQL